MKGLQWTKLPYNKIKDTIWEKFPEGTLVSHLSTLLTMSVFKGDIDYKELEQLFAAKVIEKKSKSITSTNFSMFDFETAKTEIKTVQILEHKVAQNLCKLSFILRLAKIRLSQQYFYPSLNAVTMNY